MLPATSTTASRWCSRPEQCSAHGRGGSVSSCAGVGGGGSVPRHANSCGNRGAPRACAGGPATRCGARFPRHEPLACCGTRRVGATHRGSKSQPQQHRPQHQQLVAQLQRPQQLECGRFGAAIVRAAAPGASPAVGGSGAGSAWLDYSHALVRGLPASFPDSLKLHPPSVPIDMDAAARQHAEYTRLVGTLVQCGVVEVAADEGCPDCVFIEVGSGAAAAAHGPVCVMHALLRTC
eukprot:365471-Chlamydomonas_euryale.AAC.25